MTDKMKKAALLGLFFLQVSNIFSQQDSLLHSDTSNRVLSEVIVTGVREPRLQMMVPYVAEVRNNQDILRYYPRSTPEALTGVNGVFIQKTNHGGGSPFMRGLTGNQVLILQDGIRINNATFRYGPNQYLNTIDPLTINRIEVAKGTGSVQYGTDAIGGVLQVITKEPHFAINKPAHTAALYARYMTGDMEKIIRGEWLYSGKKTAVLAGVSVKNFGDLIGGDTTGRQSPSGYQEWSYDVKTKFLLKPELQLIVASQLLQQTHVPVFHKVRLENFRINEMDIQQRELHYARLIWNGHSPLIRKAELTFSHQHTKEGRQSVKNGSLLLRKEKDEVFTTGITADIKSVWSKNWTASTGVELYMDKVHSTRTDLVSGSQPVSKRGLYPDQSLSTNLSIYSLHHLQTGHWSADAGIRLNTFRLTIPDAVLGTVHITPGAIVGNAGIVYAINKKQSVYASWNSGFRAPNIDDMGTLGIVDFRYEIPAISLQPEKSNQTEIGYKYSNKNFGLTVAGYYLRITDIITRIKSAGDTISGYPVYYKKNSDAAIVKGTEASVKWKVYKYLSLVGAIAYSYGQNKSLNEPLRRVPPLNGRTAILFETTGWYFTAECLFAAAQKRLAQGDKDDNRIPAGGTPGWMVANLYTGFFYKKLQLSSGIQNLFNKDYRTHGSGINGTGRSAWIAVSIKI
jgi:hemoglobin/transferrin/lactoferrin receptor protein